MKREAKLLKEKAFNSLLSAVEHFNRPVDRGRDAAVLIFLGHSFEMLLKAGIVHKGGEIQAKEAPNQTHTFIECLRKALSDGQIKFLTEEQVVTLRTIYELRNAAQHHLLTVPEQEKTQAIQHKLAPLSWSYYFLLLRNSKITLLFFSISGHSSLSCIRLSLHSFSATSNSLLRNVKLLRLTVFCIKSSKLFLQAIAELCPLLLRSSASHKRSRSR